MVQAGFKSIHRSVLAHDPFKANLRQEAMMVKGVTPHGAVVRAPKTLDLEKLLGK